MPLLLILYFTVAILASFFCSIWEAVLLSITPGFISTKQQEGSALGAQLKRYKDDIDRPLSAILTLNTVAHTVGAILVGVEAGKYFDAEPIPFLGLQISGEAIVAALMTFCILILSEIIPKTLGANYWRQLTPFTMSSLKVLLWIFYPAVWLSQLITKNLKNDKESSVFSRADFKALAQVGAESGALLSNESTTIKNLLRLDQISVKSVMTPRIVMTSALASDNLKTYYEANKPINHSRLPIFDDRKETVVGVLLKDDLHIALLEQEYEMNVSDLMRQPLFVNQNDPLSKLQSVLMTTKNHMAVVTDDYGSVLGLVTLEDLFETILGLEIVDETDDVADMQQLAREKWAQRRHFGESSDKDQSDSSIN